jgi:hypothetical protein
MTDSPTRNVSNQNLVRHWDAALAERQGRRLALTRGWASLNTVE